MYYAMRCEIKERRVVSYDCNSDSDGMYSTSARLRCDTKSPKGYSTHTRSGRMRESGNRYRVRGSVSPSPYVQARIVKVRCVKRRKDSMESMACGVHTT